MTMNCERARALLRGEREERRDQDLVPALRAHVASCAQCARIDAEERAFEQLLARELRPLKAPQALKDRITTQVLGQQPKPAPARGSRLRAVGLALSFAAVAIAAVLLYRLPALRIEAPNLVVREAVNDHLRVLYAAHPVEIESGGIHQVKPWFGGRVDFAPDLAFSGDDEFPLLGGAVSYFVDRKSATFVFKRRLHVISLLVFPGQGLPWPSGKGVSIGRVTAQPAELNGFHVLLWREHDLGHVLVSDAAATELLQLARKIVQSE